MHNKQVFKRFLTILVCLSLNACMWGGSSAKDDTTDEEKAVLYMEMGARYLEMGMLKTAKEKLEIAEQLDSNNAETHNIMGVLYEQLRQYQLAGEEFKTAYGLNADNAGIRNNYGRFLCERGHYEKGTQLLLEALDMPLNTRKWFAYTNLGRCELRAGRQDVAEKKFRAALQINKRYAPALEEMQKISYRSGRYMSARAFLERYLAVSKHNSETLWYAIQTERALGNEELTEQYREKLFLLFPLSKEAQQLKTAIN